jgi:CubicO group peptidase (beta-lactamase class C family)
VQLKAYGMRDVEQGAAMTTDTIFRIASMSKAVTSVAVMILVEEGALLLNDPVSKYLPAFARTQVSVPPPVG